MLTKLAIVVPLLVGLSDCAYNVPSTEWAATDPSYSAPARHVDRCVFSEEGVTSGGKLVPAGFICEAGSNQATNKANTCSWIDAYRRSDGVEVAGHVRCMTNEFEGEPYVQPRSLGTSPAYSPGVGGPVHVRGHTRKDGTYVRPHTRRR